MSDIVLLKPQNTSIPRFYDLTKRVITSHDHAQLIDEIQDRIDSIKPLIRQNGTNGFIVTKAMFLPNSEIKYSKETALWVMENPNSGKYPSFYKGEWVSSYHVVYDCKTKMEQYVQTLDQNMLNSFHDAYKATDKAVLDIAQHPQDPNAFLNDPLYLARQNYIRTDLDYADSELLSVYRDGEFMVFAYNTASTHRGLVLFTHRGVIEYKGQNLILKLMADLYVELGHAIKPSLNTQSNPSLQVGDIICYSGAYSKWLLMGLCQNYEVVDVVNDDFYGGQTLIIRGLSGFVEDADNPMLATTMPKQGAYITPPIECFVTVVNTQIMVTAKHDKGMTNFPTETFKSKYGI